MRYELGSEMIGKLLLNSCFIVYSRFVGSGIRFFIPFLWEGQGNGNEDYYYYSYFNF